ncbi:MAG: hypothetical protein HC902_14340 [Calothrix sp. SM1_5_4]|nr:hypothetical protein [Calothrix sp. SM1_5_4]
MTLSRTGSMDGDVTFDYATSDGTAIGTGPFADYVPVTGSLTIPGGAKRPPALISFINQDIWEDADSESIVINVSGGTGHATSATTGTVTIVDDDDFTLIEPLNTFSYASDEASTKAASVNSFGEVKADYGLLEGNAGLRGRFSL